MQAWIEMDHTAGMEGWKNDVARRLFPRFPAFADAICSVSISLPSSRYHLLVEKHSRASFVQRCFVKMLPM